MDPCMWLGRLLYSPTDWSMMFILLHDLTSNVTIVTPLILLLSLFPFDASVLFYLVYCAARSLGIWPIIVWCLGINIITDSIGGRVIPRGTSSGGLQVGCGRCCCIARGWRACSGNWVAFILGLSVVWWGEVDCTKTLYIHTSTLDGLAYALWYHEILLHFFRYSLLLPQFKRPK